MNSIITSLFLIILPVIFIVELFSIFNFVYLFNEIKKNIKDTLIIIASKDISDDLKQQKILAKTFKNFKIILTTFSKLVLIFFVFTAIFYLEFFLFLSKSFTSANLLLFSIQTQFIIFLFAIIYYFIKRK